MVRTTKRNIPRLVEDITIVRLDYVEMLLNNIEHVGSNRPAPSRALVGLARAQG